MMKSPGLVDWSEIVSRLKAERAARGLSLRQMASEVGLSASQLSRVENARGGPTRSVEAWRRLSDWLEPQRRKNELAEVVVGEEGALSYVYGIVDSDPDLGQPQKEVLNYLMTVAYDAYQEEGLFDGERNSGGQVSA